MKRWTAILIACLVSAAAVFGAETEKKRIHSDALDIGYSLTVSVSMVQITASVRDKWGRTVHNLTADDFRVSENGEQQPIVEFANARGFPKRILILLDVSGSMRIQNKIGVAKQGLHSLINSLQESDEVALVFFADGNLEIASSYTTDRTLILDAIGHVHAYGKTALRNAVHAAPALAQLHNAYQRSMLLITDGIDNASEVTIEEALDAARKVDLPIYALGFDPYAGREVRPHLERQRAIDALATLAEHTGGRFTLVGNSIEMLGAMDQMIRDMENQYLIGFISKVSDVSSHHRIEVMCKKGYHTRARRGYFIEK